MLIHSSKSPDIFLKCESDIFINKILNLPDKINLLVIDCDHIPSNVLRLLGNIKIETLFIRGKKFVDGDLRYLVISNINKIILDAFNVATGLKYLVGIKNIKLMYGDKIMDYELRYLMDGSEINMYNCNQITEQGIKYLTNVNNLVMDSRKIKCNAMYRFLNSFNVICDDLSHENDYKYLSKVTEIHFPYYYKLTNKAAKYLISVTNVYFTFSEVNTSLRYLTGTKSINLRYYSNIPKRTLLNLIVSINTSTLKTIMIKSFGMNISYFVKKYLADHDIAVLTFRL